MIELVYQQSTINAQCTNVAIKPVLTYGCVAIGLSDKHVTELEKLQGSLIKNSSWTIEILQKYKSDESDEIRISSIKQTIAI